MMTTKIMKMMIRKTAAMMMMPMDHLMPVHAGRTSHTVRVPSLPAGVALHSHCHRHCHQRWCDCHRNRRCNCDHCLHYHHCNHCHHHRRYNCDQNHLADSCSLLDRAAVRDELGDLPIHPGLYFNYYPGLFPIIALVSFQFLHWLHFNYYLGCFSIIALHCSRCAFQVYHLCSEQR